jgi:hypothetical protein
VGFDWLSNAIQEYDDSHREQDGYESLGDSIGLDTAETAVDEAEGADLPVGFGRE